MRSAWFVLLMLFVACAESKEMESHDSSINNTQRFKSDFTDTRPVSEWRVQELNALCGEIDNYLVEIPAVLELTCTLYGMRAGACDEIRSSCLRQSSEDYRALCFQGDNSGNLSECSATLSQVEACVEGTRLLIEQLVPIDCATDPANLRDLSAPECRSISFDVCGFSPLKPP